MNRLDALKIVKWNFEKHISNTNSEEIIVLLSLRRMQKNTKIISSEKNSRKNPISKN